MWIGHLRFVWKDNVDPIETWFERVIYSISVLKNCFLKYNHFVDAFKSILGQEIVNVNKIRCRLKQLEVSLERYERALLNSDPPVMVIFYK